MSRKGGPYRGSSPGLKPKKTREPSLAERHEHEGRTPQPGVPAGPRNTQYPSASGYEYSPETYAKTGQTPPRRSRATKRRQEARAYLRTSEKRRTRQRASSEKRAKATEKAVRSKEQAATPKATPTTETKDGWKFNRDYLHPKEPQKAEKPGTRNIGVFEPQVPEQAKAKQLQKSAREASELQMGGVAKKLAKGARQEARRASAKARKSEARVWRDQANRTRLRGERKAARKELRRARRVVKRSRKGSAGELRSAIVQTPEQSNIAKKVLRTGEQEGASRKEKLTALVTGLQETGFKNLAVGDNFTGEPAGGWREERIEYYKNPTNVKEAAKEFFREAKDDTDGMRGRGESIGDFAQTIQQSAYEGDSTFGRHVPEAKELLRQYNRGKADPKALKRLKVAKAEAEKLGLQVGKPAPDVSQGKGKTVYVRADAKGMVDWTRAVKGTNEGTAKQQRWADKTALGYTQPWCASFVSNGLLRRGITNLPSNPNYVPSYEEEWGKYAVPGGLAKAKPGDLITYSGEHIAVYVGNGMVVGGNQSDSVTETPVTGTSSYPVSMVIRPPYKGGKIAVQESTALPGSVSVTGTSSSAPAGVGLVAGPSTGPGKTKVRRMSSTERYRRIDKRLKAVGVGETETSNESPTLKALEEKYAAAA